ncbi:hypothetical protein [Jiangella asiatica]|uniref:DUF4232 domain-containing protein n=1 Tax=Jiangella asiatica TaxID=2530372 RepID=A0A4R5D3M8_9ACTN|nr:hypothetical protein [Jiangella asiatica]TDE07886.1 hypothetical protein E1269_19120 [Jiangella asiatica]
MRRGRLGWGAALAVVVVAGGAVAAGLAWSDDDGDRGTTDAPTDRAEAPDLTATAEIRRSFNRPGLVVIAVTNHGTQDVRITSAELLSDSFEATGPQSFDSTIPPGTTPRDLQLEYGTARCPDGVASSTGPASVALVAEAADGTEHELELDLPHPNGTLDRLLRTDCGAQVLGAAVDLTLSPLASQPDATLSGVLTVSRIDGSAEPAVIHDVRGSVLFTVTADPAAAAGSAERRVHFDVLRCGGHAIGDAKRPYAFTAWITLGDAEPIPTLIPVDDAARAALDAMQGVRCEDAPGDI